MITLTMGALVAISIITLVESLGRSLAVAESVLADRGHVNADLEQRVATRTGDLELALTRMSSREKRLRTILQTTQDGFWVVDMQMHFTDVNEVYCAMSGYSRAELLLMRITDVEAIERSDTTIAHVRRIVEQGADRFETRHRRKDGSIFDVEVTVTYSADSDGELLCFCRDITAQKHAAADLSLQLRYAEVLARCSQELLQPAMSEAEQQDHLTSALNILRETVGVSRLYIYQPPTDASDLRLKILADSHDASLPVYIEPSPQEIRDVPHAMLRALYTGCVFGGPVPGQFPNNPHFQHSLDQNNVQSILMIPVFVGDELWSVLSAADCVHPRSWDAPTEQLLRTAAEMIATVQQSWALACTLREREHFIQRVMQATPDVVHVVDVHTQRSLYSNRVLASETGLAAELFTTISPESFSSFIHPDDYQQVLNQYANRVASADGELIENTFRIRLGDGRERWVHTRDLVFSRDETGRATQILSVAQDITESKQTAQTLVASEARLRALRDALPDLLFNVQADGTFLDFHMPHQGDLLIEPETVLGRSLDAVLPPAIAETAMAAIKRVQTTGAMELFECILPISTGDAIFEARLMPISADELLFVVRNVTEQRQATVALLRAKEAAEAADKAKSTFLAHISHEIHTPLTAIIGMVGLLPGTLFSTQQREHLATIRVAAETLLTIIGNILDFSKVEAGQIELDTQPFDFRACLHEAIDLVAFDAQRKGLTLRCTVEPSVPDGFAGDRGRLRQVLLNLLGNAVKFTEHGTVTLMVNGRMLDAAAYELDLRIYDTGIGITPERLSQIFEPFIQADSATTRRYGGTGLGLTISQQLIEHMGGRIMVESTPGQGTCFTIVLPLAIADLPGAAGVDGGSTGVPAGNRALRVLLAEDNLVNQTVLSRLLKSLGYHCDAVGNGVMALSAVARQPYDVVLMDMQMPMLDGEEATRRIRALGADITQPYIIALTASALHGDRERYLAAGLDDYLSKPVQIEDLRTILERAPGRTGGTTAPARDLIDLPMLQHLLSSVGGPPEQMAAVVLDLFRSVLSAQMRDIAAAVAADDRPRIRLLAHKLRGGSRQLGATILADHWQVLENIAQIAGEPLDSALVDAQQVYAETLKQITAQLSALSEA
ncbi:MAG: PAS domain S-box protein [Blastochloris sp.]|nr:PAS domain S-box protein [Blastochloris sp.]